MAVKNPLALYSGKIKELQPGDTVPSSGGGGTAIKQAVLDYGAGRTSASVLVTDPSVSPDSLIVASQAWSDATTMLPLIIIGCGNAMAGRFTIHTRTADGKNATGVIRVNYIIGNQG